MAPKVLDGLIKLLINFGAGVSVALFMFFLNNRQIRANQLSQKIEKKIDKIEFQEYKRDHDERHDRDRDDLMEIKSMVRFLYENEIQNSN